MGIIFRVAQFLGIFAFLISSLTACTNHQSDRVRLGDFAPSVLSGERSEILVVAEEVGVLRDQAKTLGIKVEGRQILRLSGETSVLANLRVSPQAAVVAANHELSVERISSAHTPDEKIYYLAKRDFALPELLKEFPTYDGRGVIAGVIDDGVGPSGSGMQTTTDGKRKYLQHYWTSKLLDTKVQAILEVDKASEFFKTLTLKYDQAWEGVLDEDSLTSPSGASHDLNGDGQRTKLSVVVLKIGAEYEFCVDSDGNKEASSKECFGSFTASGEYGYWDESKPVPLVAEFIAATQTLRLSYGERSGDSHGEGVASVMVGHQIGGHFDGVAPGAQLLDIDFSSPNNDFEAGFYNIGRFVETLEWLGDHGAEVVNISYSLFFESVQAQDFMAKAISKLVEDYNFVISFSAGNNGPGLNSLNRRNIYPDNVLVAGAFVSRDLDEYVHGVTGLPDPGRVIYYSSRGPGPSGGGGPLLISPLSSLTHSAPESGFSGFSGTSSASPALAGAAAILISAVKQEGLKVDAETVVHALRLSAVPLQGTAFVDQGYGMPKLPKALELYRQLISGQQFIRVKAKVTPLSGPDGADQAGGFFRLSQLDHDKEMRVRVNGVLSPALPRSAGENLLKPVRIEYSVAWLTGPAHSWLSVGLARLGLRLNFEMVESLMSTSPGQELFGEVYILDDESGLRLHTLPVTVVDDRVWSKEERLSFSLGSRQGLRIHMGADPSVVGYRIRTEVEHDRRPFLGLGFFDTMGISKIPWSWKAAEEEEFFVATPRPGDYQLTLSRVVGTEADLPVEIQARPIRFELLSKVVTGAEPGQKAKVKVLNHGSVAEKVSLVLVRRARKIQTVVGEVAAPGEFKAEFEVTKAGTYFLKVKALSPSEWTFGYDDCYYDWVPANGQEPERNWGTEFAVPKDDPKGTLSFVCRPFAHSGDDWHRETLVGDLLFLPAGESMGEELARQDRARLVPGTNEIELDWSSKIAPGAVLELVAKPVYGGGKLSLGTLRHH